MKAISHFVFTLVLLGYMAVGCTDPTVIGGDLLNGNQLPVIFSEDTPVRVTTILSDTSQASDLSIADLPFALGCAGDATSGEVSASIGFEIFPQASVPNLLAETVDSLVLVLSLNPATQYGDTTSEISIQVLGVANNSVQVSERSTSEPLETDGQVYGSVSVVAPRQRQTVAVYTGIPDSVRFDSVNPQIRVPLSMDLLTQLNPGISYALLNDSLSSEVRDSAFLASFEGLIVEPTSCSSSIITPSLAGENASQFGVHIYTSSDTAQHEYILSPTRGSTSNLQVRSFYQHDFTGSKASQLLTGSGTNDSIALIKALDGLVTRVEFPDISEIDASIITLAVLEVPVLNFASGDAVPQIIPKIRNEVGDFENLPSATSGGVIDFTSSEGGPLVRIAAPLNSGLDSIEAYRLNLTTLFQEIALDESPQTDIFLFSTRQDQLPAVSVLAGTTGNGYRTRLLLAKTELP